MKHRMLPGVAVLLSGCAGVGFSGVEAEVSDAVATAATVRWTTSTETVGWVEYGTGEDLSLATPAESTPTLEHEAVLLGPEAGAEVTFQVVAELDGETWRGDTGTVTLGDLPVDLPELTATGSGNDRWMAVPFMGSVTGAAILTPEGRYAWYTIDETGLDVYRVRLSQDGQSVLYNAASVSGDPADDSEIVRVSLDGTEVTSIPVPLLAHDFVEHPDGTLATIVVEYGELEGEEIRGDQILEIAPDGTQKVVWSAWDCFDPATTDDPDEEGWTFANALDYDPEQEVYYLGMRSFSSIMRIPRATGECEWVFGGDQGTVEIASGSETFLHQHQFEYTGETFLVFDNDGAGGMESRVLEYTFDEEALTAEQTWSYTADPSIYTFVLGDVARLEGGDTLVDWAAGGQIDRVSPDGSVNWQLNAEMGSAFGFFTVMATPFGE